MFCTFVHFVCKGRNINFKYYFIIIILDSLIFVFLKFIGAYQSVLYLFFNGVAETFLVFSHCVRSCCQNTIKIHLVWQSIIFVRLFWINKYWVIHQRKHFVISINGNKIFGSDDNFSWGMIHHFSTLVCSIS